MEKHLIEKYIDERLIPQRKWYEIKATYNKRRFMSYQKIIILLGALIPLLVIVDSTFSFSIFGKDEWSGFISAIISAFIAVIAGFDKLQQPQTSWYNFRASEEILKKEEWLYKYAAGPYADLTKKEAEKLLVERIEGAISSDMARFTQSKHDKKEESDNQKAENEESEKNEIRKTEAEDTNAEG